MRTVGHRKSWTRVSLVVLIALAMMTAPNLEAQNTRYPTDYVYLDVDGKPLPFQDHETILEVLRKAPVVERKLMSRGVAQNIKLTLEHEGIRFHAVLRMIDVTERAKTSSQRIVVKYRDSHIFEVAAYRLNELLGIGRIPPTVERRVGEHQGSVQIWMEGTAPEDLLLERGPLKPPDTSYWWRQKGVMWVLDALIANTDRNQGNLLIDSDWNLWFIDHTRAFREISKLLDISELNTCERSLWAALQETEDEAIRETLEPYLTSKEISNLLLRRTKLIKHFKKKIKKRGEDKVLYDLR